MTLSTDVVLPSALVTQSRRPPAALAPTRLALEAIRRGEPVIVVDDEDRENEGDFIVAASHATPAVINFMITHGRGLLCAPLTRARADELQLPAMTHLNTDPMATAFTVSVDAGPEHGVTTGISASDRAATVHQLLHGSAADLRRPGHIFPLVARDGGVLTRPGHTEAGVDMARLAGLPPAAIIIEILREDGSMARLRHLLELADEHGLLVTTIADLVAHRRQVESAA